MRLILTRPLADSLRTAEALKAMGHEAIVAPLLSIVPCDGPALALDGVQALLVTSANGAEALARRTARRDLPVFAVGPQSAKTARDAGFAQVESAQGDAKALAALIVQRLSPQAGALFHAAGRETRGGLAEDLSVHGFMLCSETLYEATAATALPDAARQALVAGAADGVMLYSPRSAEIFRTLIDKEGLRGCAQSLSAYCISRATADALSGLAFARLAVAARPDQAGMLDLLPGGGACPASC